MVEQALKAAMTKRATVADGTLEAAEIDRDIAALVGMLPVRLIQGNAIEALRTLPAGSAQVCVTSPPYFGQRDYGVKGQIGLERTPRAYVAGLVNVFGQVRRVLRDDGVLWLNLGDSFANNPGNGRGGEGKGFTLGGKIPHRSAVKKTGNGFKTKDLLGIPWRVAFALQKAGWYLRCAAPWVKRNAMPDSVKDRPVTAVEYWFMLTKSARYYYDPEAVCKASLQPNGTPRTAGRRVKQEALGRRVESGSLRTNYGPKTRSRRNSDWWFESVGMLLNESGEPLGFDVPTVPYRGAHFATFPPKLIEPQILSCSRLGDVVLDPFNGAGTTGLVATRNGRRYVGIDLNPEYLELTKERLRGG